jgi:lipopolysaccharide transport system permease protein
MVGVIDGFRWCLLGGACPLLGWSFFVAAAIVVVMAISGFLFFRRTERGFADVI